MASFSQRHGYTPAQHALQLETMDVPLRTAIWNAVHIVFFEDAVSHDGTSGSPIGPVTVPAWVVFLQQPADDMPSTNGAWAETLKTFIYKQDWFRVYDLVELLHRRSPRGAASDVRRGSECLPDQRTFWLPDSGGCGNSDHGG